jgi:hypothetical protein
VTKQDSGERSFPKQSIVPDVMGTTDVGGGVAVVPGPVLPEGEPGTTAKPPRLPPEYSQKQGDRSRIDRSRNMGTTGNDRSKRSLKSPKIPPLEIGRSRAHSQSGTIARNPPTTIRDILDRWRIEGPKVNLKRGRWVYEASNETLQFASSRYRYEVDLERNSCLEWADHLRQTKSLVMTPQDVADMSELWNAVEARRSRGVAL